MFKAISVIAVIASAAWAQPATPASLASLVPKQMHYGFSPIDSSAIPQAVRDQSEFIYHISMPYYVQASADQYQDLLSLPHLPDEGRQDLQRCQQAKLKFCQVRFSDIRGTAFMDKSGEAIWTNCHIVTSWISHQTQNMNLDGLSAKAQTPALLAQAVPMELVDVKGQTLLKAGQLNADSGHLTNFVLDRDTEAGTFSCALMDDAVKISLPPALRRPSGPKRVATSPATTAGEQLYIGGNPRPSNDRTQLGGLDSDGIHTFWTSGKLLPRGPESDAYYSSMVDMSFVLSGPYAQTVLADGDDGSSGSPVFNSDGEVVGIYMATAPMPAPYADVPYSSVFLDADELGFVELYDLN